MSNGSPKEVRSCIIHQDYCDLISSLPVAHGVSSGAGLLASGSADNSIRIWSIDKGLCDRSGKKEGWRLISVLQGHKAPITSLACHPMQGADSFILISTAGDGGVNVWQCSPHITPPADLDPISILAHMYGQGTWSLTQTIKEGSHIMQSVAITFLPSEPSNLLLACGGTDKNVRLYTSLGSTTPVTFKPVCVLSGPENWVRSLAFEHALTANGVEVLLACASQDRYVRIWSIQEKLGEASKEASEIDLIPKYAPKPEFLTLYGSLYGATLDAVLVGHEDWIHTVCWRPSLLPSSSNTSSSTITQSPSPRSSLSLMTASMDRSMMLWSHVVEGSESLWMSHASIGDAGAQCLGYFTGCFSSCDGGKRILAHGFTGALHLWEEVPSVSSASKLWEPRQALGGHFAAVTGCAWGGDGACLLTASEDQTVRLFTQVSGPWCEAPLSGHKCGVSGHWCEAGRPQIHGHDFSCITAVPNPSDPIENVIQGPFSSSIYVSGSEEKILRVFEAPQVFIDTLNLARGRPVAGGDKKMKQRAFGASIPALGLSNKAVFEGEVTKGEAGGEKGDGFGEGSDFVSECTPSVVAGRPLEEHLAQNTLWPELHKLYGHGDDVHCVSASHDGTLIASGCVAKSTAAAEVWIWEVGTWKGIAQLQAHTLTVTQLSWSSDDDMLASCSRDRSFAVIRRIRSSEGNDSFQLIQRVKNAHARILWGITWSPHDKILATGSRDELVKLWGVIKGTHDESSATSVTEKPLIALPAFQSAVTCLSFCPLSLSGSCLLAIGLEDGNLQIWSIPTDGDLSQIREIWRASTFIRHGAALSALCWRDAGNQGEGGEHNLELATCGRDHAVACYTIRLK